MPLIQQPSWQEADQEITIRPKKNTAIKRNETFAAADGLRYNAADGKRRRRGDRFRYTFPLYPPTPGFLSGQSAEAPPDLYVRTSLELYEDTFGGEKKNVALSGDQIHQLTTILALPDQFSPRSASSGFGSIGFASSDVSFRSNARSLNAVSPDSAISLFSSTPSKIGSLSAKKHIHFEIEDLEEEPRRVGQSYLNQSRPRVEAPIEYGAPKVFGRATETKYVTTVFEVLRRGLADIAHSVRDEMRRFSDQGLIIVCCEMRWSTPDRYRDILTETQLKTDVLNNLRVNNSRIWDTVGESSKSQIEELMSRKRQHVGGSYRRHYDNLTQWAHDDAAREHEVWWRLQRSIELDDEIDWPMIAPRNMATIVMLNLICLKIGHY